MERPFEPRHATRFSTSRLLNKALASTLMIRKSISIGRASKKVGSCGSSPLDVFQTPPGSDDAPMKLVLKGNFNDGEHDIYSTLGEAYFRIPAMEQAGEIRSITDTYGITLCSLIKREDNEFELLRDCPEEPLAAVIRVAGKPGKPKLVVEISKDLVPGECNGLKVKGDLFGHNFKVFQFCPDDVTKAVTLVAKSTPIENSDQHVVEIAPKVDMSLIVALCLVISEIRESVHNILVDPPLVVLSPQWVSQKRSILTPVIIDNMVAIVDCGLNTIVYRDRDMSSMGRGQFMDVCGKCSFVLEASGKNLCLYLRGKPGMRDNEVLVFSKKKKPRGVREICVSKVNSFEAMSNKAARKAGCLLGIRVDCQNEPEIRMRRKGGPSDEPQLIGRVISAGLSPDTFTEMFEKCHLRADPRNRCVFEHFGICVEVAAGVDRELMSAVILATLVLIPKLGKPCEGELNESLEGSLRRCDDVLGLRPLHCC